MDAVCRLWRRQSVVRYRLQANVRQVIQMAIQMAKQPILEQGELERMDTFPRPRTESPLGRS